MTPTQQMKHNLTSKAETLIGFAKGEKFNLPFEVEITRDGNRVCNVKHTSGSGAREIESNLPDVLSPGRYNIKVADSDGQRIERDWRHE